MEIHFNHRAEGLEADCASSMFVLGRDERRNYLIRLSVTLQEDVDPGILQEALDEAVRKYPYFFIRFTIMDNRFFAWPVRNEAVVHRKGSTSILAREHTTGRCEAQAAWSGRTIFFEYFHGVSDGMGGLIFLLYLTAVYLSRRYGDEKILESVPVIPMKEQIRDGYKSCARGFHTSGDKSRAWHIKGTDGSQKITSYEMSASAVREKAKQYSVSVTDYLAALLFRALYELQQETGDVKKKIRLSVPVNLRTRFSIRTTRNCTLNVYPQISPGTDSMDMASVCKTVRKYMQEALRTERLAGRCAASDLAGSSAPVKMLPVKFKKWIVQNALDLPHTGSTITFSNMGAVSVPEHLQEYITDLDVIFTAKPESPYSCSAVTLGDRLKITFLRTIREPLLERQFERIVSADVPFEKGGTFPGRPG